MTVDLTPEEAANIRNLIVRGAAHAGEDAILVAAHLIHKLREAEKNGAGS